MLNSAALSAASTRYRLIFWLPGVLIATSHIDRLTSRPTKIDLSWRQAADC